MSRKPVMFCYKITYQWRNPLGCVGDPNDWRSWRCFGSVPIVFGSREAAQSYMDMSSDIFANMRHLRKVSCAINPLDYRPSRGWRHGHDFSTDNLEAH